MLKTDSGLLVRAEEMEEKSYNSKLHKIHSIRGLYYFLSASIQIIAILVRMKRLISLCVVLLFLEKLSIAQSLAKKYVKNCSGGETDAEGMKRQHHRPKRFRSSTSSENSSSDEGSGVGLPPAKKKKSHRSRVSSSPESVRSGDLNDIPLFRTPTKENGFTSCRFTTPEGLRPYLSTPAKDNSSNIRSSITSSSTHRSPKKKNNSNNTSFTSSTRSPLKTDGSKSYSRGSTHEKLGQHTSDMPTKNNNSANKSSRSSTHLPTKNKSSRSSTHSPTKNKSSRSRHSTRIALFFSPPTRVSNSKKRNKSTHDSVCRQRENDLANLSNINDNFVGVNPILDVNFSPNNKSSYDHTHDHHDDDHDSSLNKAAVASKFRYLQRF